MPIAAVFQIGSLGDSIVSLPVLRSLRDLLPDCSEYLLVSRRDNATNVVPAHVFDMVWPAAARIEYRRRGTAFGQSASVGRLLAQLRYYRPRYCVSMMPSERSKRQVERDKLYFRLGGVKELFGFSEFVSLEIPDGPEPLIRCTEAYLRLRRVWNGQVDEKFAAYGTAPVLRPGKEADDRVQEWLKINRRYPDRNLVAVCPYSNHIARSLADETIADVLMRLEKTARVETVLIGSRKDNDAASRASHRSGSALNACGVFSLEESAALLQACKLAVCAESGPMHLAGAVGAPTVITFSRVNKQLCRWFPLGTGHTILYRDVSCSGCCLTACSVEGHPCMRGITAEEIVAAAIGKLNGFDVLPGNDPGATRVTNW